MWSITDVGSVAFYSFFIGFWFAIGTVIAICSIAFVFGLFDDEIII